jgi:hypothetical protein
VLIVDSEDDEPLSQMSKQAPVAHGHAVISGNVSARTAFNLFDDEQNTAGDMDAVNDSDYDLEELGEIERECEADTYKSDDAALNNPDDIELTTLLEAEVRSVIVFSIKLII